MQPKKRMPAVRIVTLPHEHYRNDEHLIESIGKLQGRLEIIDRKELPKRIATGDHARGAWARLSADIKFVTRLLERDLDELREAML